MNKKIVCIVGPTASGKTGLAVKICQKFNGEIVSADSRQVYRFLNLGTGKEGEPRLGAKLKVKSKKLKEIAKDIRYIDNVPQWLVDICEPEEKFTVFDWLKLARLVTEDIFSRGKMPVVVGGTGLYVQALIEGFALEMQKSPDAPRHLIGEVRGPDLRQPAERREKSKIYKREKLDKMPKEKLVDILNKLSPEKLTEIDVKNPRRLIRAIEISQQGNKPIKVKPDFEVLELGITMARQELYQKIDRRVEERFKLGMLEEVEDLVAQKVNPKWLLSLGLEYKIIGEYVIKNEKLKIKNENFEKMKQELKYKIHAYARRQLTWFRRFEQIKWVKNSAEAVKATANFLK